MGFAAGTVTFRRFAVIGEHPKEISPEILEKLGEFVLKVGEYGVPEEVEYGWSGGRHIFDGSFSFEQNVFNDALHFALRLDTNRVPGQVKLAYQLMEEDAAGKGNPSGFASKKQKVDAKDVVRRKINEDLKSGKFRRTKLVPILWDFPNQVLYTPASSVALESLLELFERTFGLSLEALSAGSLGLRVLEGLGRRRDYEDSRPTRFVPGPDGENQHPEYPWCTKGPQPKDFFGNEFLLWIWHEAEARGGTIATSDTAEVGIVLDRMLELDCAYGQTGRDVLKGDGPTHMPEARDGLRSGKLPRKVGLILETGGQTFNLTLSPESFTLSGVKMPEIEEAEDARVLFEERIIMLRDLVRAVDGLYERFLKLRCAGSWEGQTSALRRWIMREVKQAAA